MPAVRELLKHATIEAAGAYRICHRNKKEHSTAKGESFLLTKDDDLDTKNYCAANAGPVLDQSTRNLSALVEGLEP